jgi:hypothetical protein
VICPGLRGSSAFTVNPDAIASFLLCASSASQELSGSAAGVDSLLSGLGCLLAFDEFFAGVAFDKGVKRLSPITKPPR